MLASSMLRAEEKLATENDKIDALIKHVESLQDAPDSWWPSVVFPAWMPPSSCAGV